MSMITKSGLAILLSRLKTFEKPKLLEEQYPVDSEVAAELLWFAYMNKDVEGKVIADFGCGTGRLGIAALLLGAEKVFFVDSDADALGLLKKNIALVEKNTAAKLKNKLKIIKQDIKKFDGKVDVVVQNPPFGTKARHADKAFLEKAFKSASVIYSFHKLTSLDFIKKVSEDAGFKVTHVFRFSFSLKQTHKFHDKRIYRVNVGCWRLERKK
jgi:putative methylase